MTIETISPINEYELESHNTFTNEVEAVAEEKFSNRQTGRLIAKLIAIVRDKHNYKLEEVKNQTIRELNQSNIDIGGRNLTRFIAQVYTNPRRSPEPFVNRLLEKHPCNINQNYFLTEEILSC